MAIRINNNDLADEVTALNAIYGKDLIVAISSNSHHTALSVKFPAFGFSFYVRVLDDYPQSPPEVVGIDSLVQSRNLVVQQNSVYFGACMRAVHHPQQVCLFDAINEFETVYKSIQASNRPSEMADDAVEGRAARKAPILRGLAIRARAKAGSTRGDSFIGDSLYDVVDCSSCLELFFRVNTANLSCRHSFCPECLRGMFLLVLRASRLTTINRGHHRHVQDPERAAMLW